MFTARQSHASHQPAKPLEILLQKREPVRLFHRALTRQFVIDNVATCVNVCRHIQFDLFKTK
jgi:hypothetical protein